MKPKANIPVLLLAAGKGTRLAPLTDSAPKCLVPISGRPLLGYWLEGLSAAGCGPLVVNTHHHAETVRKYVNDSLWRDNVILTHEEELLGTAGTLLANREYLGDGSFMVIHADNLSRFRVEDFWSAHHNRPHGCVMTMMLFHTPTPRSCGVVELDARGVVTAFHEKSPDPPGNLANAAIFAMEAEVFDVVAEWPALDRAPDISLDIIPRFLGRVFSWLNSDYHRDIGTPESYAQAQKEFRMAGMPSRRTHE